MYYNIACSICNNIACSIYNNIACNNIAFSEYNRHQLEKKPQLK